MLADLVRFFVINVMLTVSGNLGANVNSLNGQHLRVVAMEFPTSLETKRNATGHVIYVDGAQKHMIEALSQMLNFSYSFLPVVALLADDTPAARGGIYYLLNDEADYLLSTTFASANRLQKVDFPASWGFGPLSTLLPNPKETVDYAASFKPLSYECWILIAVSTLVTVLVLKIVCRRFSWYQLREKENDGVKGNKGVYNSGNGNIVLYVMGNLVSQGQHYFPNRLTIRIVVGAWSCACFFLVQIYCSTLTSHLTEPNPKPLIKSFFEIADTPGVSLTMDQGYALDQMLQMAQSPEHLKRFTGILMKENRYITCKKTSDCLEFVNNGNAVYVGANNILKTLMVADLKSTGTCHFTRTKETFWGLHVFTVLRKSSPHTESLSRGILRLREAGLLDGEWERRYVPSASKCMKVNERKGMPRLSLKHLSSAFIILAAGCLISLIAFITETIVAKLARFYQVSRERDV